MLLSPVYLDQGEEEGLSLGDHRAVSRLAWWLRNVPKEEVELVIEEVLRDLRKVN